MYDAAEDPRMGGEVQRWHCWPTIQRQDNANHQWNVARIVLAIWPTCDKELLIEALFHDIGEVGAGDAPSPTKSSTVFRSIHREIEDRTRTAMILPWGVPHKRMLTDLEEGILKLADVIERWEFSSIDYAMGNSLAKLVIDRTSADIDQRLASKPTELVNAIGWYMDKRSSTWQT